MPHGRVMGWPRSPGRLAASEGDWGLYPGTGGPCWTLAIGVLLRAWDKMVPTLPCLLLRSSTHRKPVEGQRRVCGGALGRSSWACGGTVRRPNWWVNQQWGERGEREGRKAQMGRLVEEAEHFGGRGACGIEEGFADVTGGCRRPSARVPPPCLPSLCQHTLLASWLLPLGPGVKTTPHP